MKIILSLLLFPAVVFAEQCENYGLYAFVLEGCPQAKLNPAPDLSIPLCQQPGFEQYAFMDYRCFVSVPFDYDNMCYSWNCAVPYEHVFLEPLSGRTMTYRGDAREIDWHYRACRESLGLALGVK